MLIRTVLTVICINKIKLLKQLQNYTAEQSWKMTTLTNTNTLFWNTQQLFIGLAQSKFNIFPYEALKRLFLFAVEAGCVKMKDRWERSSNIPLVTSLKI